MVNNVYLGLGSNLGDRLKYLSNAVKLIDNDPNCSLIESSSVYETTPYGAVDQDNYYNVVIYIKTSLDPAALLVLIKQFEIKAGRKSDKKKWGPREIDIDILFYNNLIYDNDKLNIPHPEILSRDFVLIPLKEIAPDFIHPLINKKIIDVSHSAIEKHIIQKLNYSLF
jgi:2-amino-4-hydroxy-6-hydroxymethyldihydropteridine diphosphokinase